MVGAGRCRAGLSVGAILSGVSLILWRAEHAVV